MFLKIAYFKTKEKNLDLIIQTLFEKRINEIDFFFSTNVSSYNTLYCVYMYTPMDRILNEAWRCCPIQ